MKERVHTRFWKNQKMREREREREREKQTKIDSIIMEFSTHRAGVLSNIFSKPKIIFIEKYFWASERCEKTEGRKNRKKKNQNKGRCCEFELRKAIVVDRI